MAKRQTASMGEIEKFTVRAQARFFVTCRQKQKARLEAGLYADLIRSYDAATAAQRNRLSIKRP